MPDCFFARHEPGTVAEVGTRSPSNGTRGGRRLSLPATVQCTSREGAPKLRASTLVLRHLSHSACKVMREQPGVGQGWARGFGFLCLLFMELGSAPRLGRIPA